MVEWTHIKASSLSSKRVVGHIWRAKEGGGEGEDKVLTYLLGVVDSPGLTSTGSPVVG